jgi:hypothetical protein
MNGAPSKCRENQAMRERSMSCEAQKLGSWGRHGACFIQWELLGGEGDGCLESSTFLDAVPAEIFLSSQFAHRLPGSMVDKQGDILCKQEHIDFLHVTNFQDDGNNFEELLLLSVVKELPIPIRLITSVMQTTKTACSFCPLSSCHSSFLRPWCNFRKSKGENFTICDPPQQFRNRESLQRMVLQLESQSRIATRVEKLCSLASFLDANAQRASMTSKTSAVIHQSIIPNDVSTLFVV